MGYIFVHYCISPSSAPERSRPGWRALALNPSDYNTPLSNQALPLLSNSFSSIIIVVVVVALTFITVATMLSSVPLRMESTTPSPRRPELPSSVPSGFHPTDDRSRSAYAFNSLSLPAIHHRPLSTKSLLAVNPLSGSRQHYHTYHHPLTARCIV